MNAGLRINERFDVSTNYAGNNLITETNPKPFIFINVGLYIVNFTKKRKK